jgi:hypothetical protein
VTEGDDDLRPGCPLTQELDDLSTQEARRIGSHRGHPFGVEEHHSRPADLLAPAIGGFEQHHEQIALVIERVLAISEVGEGLETEGFQKVQVLLSPFEGLLHRDHAVSEHSCLGHRDARVLFFLVRSPDRAHPIWSGSSLKTSRAMIKR